MDNMISVRQVVRAFFEAEGLTALAPHSALYDAATTAFVFGALLEAGLTVEDMVRVSESPALLARCHFGKHAGLPWSRVPKNYLTWMLRQTGEKAFGEDEVFTAQHWIERGKP
jgi:hypothetical protein